MIYWELFLCFLKIGLFSFGGGYAALPLIEQEIVEIRGWLTAEAFSDLITISQMTPGPIAINTASFVGLKMGGVLGAIIASVTNVLPGVLIVMLLAKLYEKYSELPSVQAVLKGLRSVIVALIARAAYDITKITLLRDEGLSSYFGLNFFSLILFLLSLLAYEKLKKMDPIIIMLVMGVIGGFAFYIFKF